MFNLTNITTLSNSNTVIVNNACINVPHISNILIFIFIVQTVLLYFISWRKFHNDLELKQRRIMMYMTFINLCLVGISLYYTYKF